MAAGITIRGKGEITQNNNSSLINKGTIAADVAGQPLRVISDLQSLINQGTMRATGGGILDLANTWTNTGLIQATASTLTLRGSWTNAGGVITVTDSTTNLGGTFTIAQLGTFNRTGGAVNLTGVFDNRGKTLALNASTGSWKLDGGTIWGGTVTGAQGAALGSTSFASLDGVTLNADLTAANAEIFVSNGLALNGVLTLDNSNNSTRLHFNSGVQTLAGTGQVVLAGTQPFGEIRLGYGIGATALTVAAGITIRGMGAIPQSENSSLVNRHGGCGRGRSAAGIALKSFTNHGTMRATGGGILDLTGDWVSTGTLTETSGTLKLGGKIKTSMLGTLSGDGGVISFTGTLTNDVELTLPGAAINPHYALTGGRIATTGGAELFATGLGGLLDAVTLEGGLHLGDVNGTICM